MDNKNQKFLAILAAFAAIFVLGACSGKLVADPTPIAAIDANYPTAEFRACGHTWNGLGMCKLKVGDSFSTINLQIQGYGDGLGSLRVDSKECAISASFSYNANQLVSIPISGVAQKSCVVTFTVAPEYGDEKNGITLSAIRGFLVIKAVRDGDDWQGTTLKATGSWAQSYRAWIGGSGSVDVMMSGCGVDYAQTLQLSNGYVTIPLQSAVPRGTIKTCVIDGIVKSPQYQDFFFDILVAQYNSTFVILPQPVLTMVSGGVKVEADGAVSVIAVNASYYFDRKKTIKFDTSQPAIFRALTVKGRNALSIWDPAKKEWTWIP